MTLANAIDQQQTQLAKIAGEIRAGIIRRVREVRQPNEQDLLQMMQVFHTLDEEMEVDGLRFAVDTINLILAAAELNYGKRTTDEALLSPRKP